MDSMLYRRVARLFAQLQQEQPVIVFDVDDVLWPLIYRVAERGGLDPVKCTAIFKIRDNHLLTKAEQDYIIESFADAKVFKNIPFYPGIANILQPQEIGAIVRINSNSFSKEIAALKTEQLLAAVPGLKPEQIQMNIVDHNGAHRKPLAPETTILIEDSPSNVRLSPALLNVMPSNLAWTHCANAIQVMTGKCVTWKPNLLQINTLLYQLTTVMMKGDLCYV